MAGKHWFYWQRYLDKQLEAQPETLSTQDVERARNLLREYHSVKGG